MYRITLFYIVYQRCFIVAVKGEKKQQESDAYPESKKGKVV